MELGFLRRARIAGHAFSDIANWREVLPRATVGKSVTEIRLRNGSIITICWHAVRPIEDEPVTFRHNVCGKLTDDEFERLSRK